MNQEEMLDVAKRWRVGKGITQQQVADAMSTTQSEVSRIESGRGDISLRLFIDYIESMGLEITGIGVME